MADLKGKIIGGFKIIGSLQAGAGSQGAVYQAIYDGENFPALKKGSTVALKIMPVADESSAYWSKVQRRTDELCALSHSSIVRYYGCFKINDFFHDSYVIVEEFLEGESLKDLLARSKSGIDVDEALRIMNAVLDALEYISSRGIVHRDIKPGNIFLGTDGAVKLIDFEVAGGIADATTATGSGNFQGTFDYMAPEFTSAAFRGDVKSDVFSLGVVFHEMLTGKLPYPILDTTSQQASFVFMSRWERLFSENIHPIRISSRIKRLLSGCVDVLERAIDPHRENRFDSFSSFKDALQTVKYVELHNEDRTYRLLRFIGKGGFGEVFKARLLNTGECVAVKHLLKAAYAERFYREARIMAKLNDPCFVRLVDFFVVGELAIQEAFLVMAFLDGMPGNSLRDAISAAKGTRLSWPDVLKAFARYAHGLAMMHQQDVFHRDIKPSNLYYPSGKPDSAAIMDLGIARDEHGTATHGQVPGTLDYMPPEVIVSNNRGDEGMDIYALGLCLYEALTGKTGFPRLPPGTSGYTQFFARARSRQAPDFSDAEVARRPDLLNLLREMTNPDEKKRLKDANAVAVRLLQIRERGDSEVSVVSSKTNRNQSFYSGVYASVPVENKPPKRIINKVEHTYAPKPSEYVVPKAQNAQHYRQFDRKYSETPIISLEQKRRLINWITIFVIIGVTLFIGYVSFPSVKLLIAKAGAEKICETYNNKGFSAGNLLQEQWINRWSPRTGGFLAIDYPDFVDCTNRFCSVRTSAEALFEKERKQAELDAQRMTSLSRLSECRQMNGRLNESNFRRLNGWELPQWLNKDPEVLKLLPRIGRCLLAFILKEIEIEPVSSRRDRLKKARSFLENSWTRRMLSEEEYEKIKKDISVAESSLVCIVGNACADLINIGNVAIPSGGTKTIVLSDGGIHAPKVKRIGYNDLPFPKGVDGKTISFLDEHFIPAPVKMTIPKVEDDVICAVGESSGGSGMFFMLKPGNYICEYSRTGFYSQRRTFTVRVSEPSFLPSPNDWRPKNVDLERSDEKSINTPKNADSSYISYADVSTEDLKLAHLRSIKNNCRAKLALEPVENRQDRLDEAGRVLAQAVAVDRIMTEEDAAPLYEAIEERRRWAVGKVHNMCSHELTIGEFKIPPQKEKVLVFKKGLPHNWIAELPGYHPKTLMRDFDGRTLRFSEGDFVPKNP